MNPSPLIIQRDHNVQRELMPSEFARKYCDLHIVDVRTRLRYYYAAEKSYGRLNNGMNLPDILLCESIRHRDHRRSSSAQWSIEKPGTQTA